MFDKCLKHPEVPDPWPIFLTLPDDIKFPDILRVLLMVDTLVCKRGKIFQLPSNSKRAVNSLEECHADGKFAVMTGNF